VESLQKAGYEVVEFKVPKPQFMVNYYFSLMSADGMKTLGNELKEDLADSSVSGTILLGGVGSVIRSFIGIVLNYALGFKRLAQLFINSGGKTVTQTWQLQRGRAQYQQEFYQALKHQQIDVLVCPAMTTVAVPHNSQKNLTPSVISYTFAYNLLDYPAGIVPITTVT